MDITRTQEITITIDDMDRAICSRNCMFLGVEWDGYTCGYYNVGLLECAPTLRCEKCIKEFGTEE